MTTSILRPDAAGSNVGVTVTGAATAWQALSDNSDASYIELAIFPGGACSVNIGTVSLPAGAVTKTVTGRLRGINAGGVVRLRLITGISTVLGDFNLTGSIANYTSAAFATSLTQAEIDGAVLYLENADFTVVRIHEIYLDVVYATVPVTAVSAPTGAITLTSSPTATWSHTAGSDGGPQSRYRVKVFSAAQYGIGGFDPETSPHTFDSGEQISVATSAVVGPLPNGGTWRCYVKTAQTINGAPHWAVWAFSSFTTAFTEPTIASVAVTAVPASARFDILVTRTVMVPTWIACDVQRSIDAGATWTFVRGATNAAASGTTFSVIDYEAPFATSTLYRARAVSALITGPWVNATAATISPTTAWLKAVSTPALNKPVCIRDVPSESFGKIQSVNVVLGRDEPVVISDVRRLAVGAFSILTATAAERIDLAALLASPSIMLLQVPLAVGGVVELFFVSGQVDVDRPPGGGKSSLPQRIHSIGYTAVRRPAEGV